MSYSERMVGVGPGKLGSLGM